MKTSDIIEYAIEFAWQIGDTDETIPRAESRWIVLDKVLDFIKKNKNPPDEDIDEFVQKFLVEESDKKD